MVTETTLVSDLPSCSKVHSKTNASMSLFAKPNDIHQSDLLSLPHHKFKKKTYKYALNIVDVASRYKGSYQLTTKNANNNNKTNDLILNLTPENVTQHSRIVITTRKGSSTPTKMSKIIGRQIH